MLHAAASGVPHQIQVQPGGGPPQQAPSDQQDASPDAQAFMGALSRVLADLHTLAPLTDDEGERQTVLKCLTALQQIQATEQKERESLLGQPAMQRALRRS